MEKVVKLAKYIVNTIVKQKEEELRLQGLIK